MELMEGYKKTEAGVIPDDWKSEKIGQSLKICHGRNQREVESINGEYPILGTGGEIGKSTTPLYSKPSVLIGRKGTIDVPRFIETPFWTVDTLFYSEVFSNSIPKYLYYQFCMIDWYSYNEASGVPSLNARTIEKIEIPKPPTIAEQQVIAETLSDADALIESLEKLIEKKRQIKQGAMQELLTGKKRLPGFSGEWVEKLLNSVTWFQEGPGVRTSQFTSSGIKLLNGTNIYNGVLHLDSTSRYISEKEAYGAYAHFMAEAGDIVIASSGITIDKFDQKVAFVRNDNLPFCMNTSTIRFKPYSKINPNFLYHYLKSSHFKDQIGGQATGSAQLNFGPSHLDKILIDLPDTDEQIAIAEILSDLDAELQSLEEKLTKARQLKQGMMQALLTGKIRLV